MEEKNVCPFRTLTTLNLYSHMFRENQVKACDAVANALSFNIPEPTPPKDPEPTVTTDNCNESDINRANIICIKTGYGA